MHAIGWLFGTLAAAGLRLRGALFFSFAPAAYSTLGGALFHEPIVHQGQEGLVVVRDIDFASTSQDSLLPFHGRCHVAYVPRNGVVLGLSKLARVTKQYAKRLTSQERLGADITAALLQNLDCHGVAVALQARHLVNNAQPIERCTATTAGCFADKASSHLEVSLGALHVYAVQLWDTALAKCWASQGLRCLKVPARQI